MSHSNTVAITLVALSLIAAPTASAQEKPPSSRWVEVSKPSLAKKGNTYFLVHAITSTVSKDLSWALVEVNSPDGSRKCEWLKRLEPKQAYRFECPLQEAAGQKFASRVRVYSNAKLKIGSSCTSPCSMSPRRGWPRLTRQASPQARPPFPRASSRAWT